MTNGFHGENRLESFGGWHQIQGRDGNLKWAAHFSASSYAQTVEMLDYPGSEPEDIKTSHDFYYLDLILRAGGLDMEADRVFDNYYSEADIAMLKEARDSAFEEIVNDAKSVLTNHLGEQQLRLPFAESPVEIYEPAEM
jgi:hypothetical protein